MTSDGKELRVTFQNYLTACSYKVSSLWLGEMAQQVKPLALQTDI